MLYGLLRTFLLIIMICSPLIQLQAQDKLSLASKLMDEAEQDPNNEANIKKINTAIAYLEEALKDMKINCKKISETERINGNEVSKSYILILPTGEHKLNRFANGMKKFDVELVFDPHYLISKKAIASFEEPYQDDTQSTINVSREFIENQGIKDKLSVRHEIRHLLSYILKALGYDSLFNARITFDKESEKTLYKKGFNLDEIAAWSEDVYGLTRRFNQEFTKSYLGFHPEVKDILHSLDLYLKKKGLAQDPLYRMILQRLSTIIFSYANNKPTTKEGLKKIESLFRMLSDYNEEELINIKNKILNLSNRNLVAETENIADLSLLIDYYDVANDRTRRELIREIYTATLTLDGLILEAQDAMDAIDARCRSTSHETTTEDGYQRTWKYTSNIVINYKSYRNKTTNNNVHHFVVSDEANLKIYRVSITSDKELEDPRELLFTRMWEQTQLFNKIKQNNKIIMSRIEEYVKDINQLKQKKETVQEKAKPRKDLLEDILEYSKIMSGVCKENFSSDIMVRYLIEEWKYHISLIEKEKEQRAQAENIQTTEVPNTNTNTNTNTDIDDQFCEYGFDNITKMSIKDLDNDILEVKIPSISNSDVQTIMKDYTKTQVSDYEELLNLVFKKLSEQKELNNIGKEEKNLLFGKKNELGNRTGGLYNYWMQNKDEGENWIYIAVTGAVIYEKMAKEEEIADIIHRSYIEIGILNTSYALIEEKVKYNNKITPLKNLELMNSIEMLRKSSNTNLKKIY